MDIRRRFFPYPVLSNFSDDYSSTSFCTEVLVNKEINDLVFKFKSSLDNENLKFLIKDDKADYVYHIECSQTSYRKVVVTSDKEYKFMVPEDRLNNKVSVCSFVIAKDAISKYYNKSFHEDFNGTSFDIERGNILAIGSQVNFNITKELEELYKIPSIFSIIREDTDGNIGININPDGDKIQIQLNNEDFANYQILANRPDIQPSIHAMLIFPALVQIFEKIKTSENLEEFEDKRWYKAIDGQLKKGNLTLSSENIEIHGSHILAQRLLGLPINRALKALTNIGEEDGE